MPTRNGRWGNNKKITFTCLETFPAHEHVHLPLYNCLYLTSEPGWKQAIVERTLQPVQLEWKKPVELKKTLLNFRSSWCRLNEKHPLAKKKQKHTKTPFFLNQSFNVEEREGNKSKHVWHTNPVLLMTVQSGDCQLRLVAYDISKFFFKTIKWKINRQKSSHQQSYTNSCNVGVCSFSWCCSPW